MLPSKKTEACLKPPLSGGVDRLYTFLVQCKETFFDYFQYFLTNDFVSLEFNSVFAMLHHNAL